MNKKEIIESQAWLGLFKAFHEIGDYSFVEYSPTVFDGVSPAIPHQYHEYTYFTPFINGKGIGNSYISLDHALVGVIAYRHDGANTNADEYFMKAINPTNTIHF